jgi:hypothetical protein
MAGRTAADALADYTAVRAAWLKSLTAESYGIGGRNLQRSKSESLKKQMLELDAEVKRLSRGGMRVRTIETDTDG